MPLSGYPGRLTARTIALQSSRWSRSSSGTASRVAPEEVVAIVQVSLGHTAGVGALDKKRRLTRLRGSNVGVGGLLVRRFGHLGAAASSRVVVIVLDLIQVARMGASRGVIWVCRFRQGWAAIVGSILVVLIVTHGVLGLSVAVHLVGLGGLLHASCPSSAALGSTGALAKANAHSRRLLTQTVGHLSLIVGSSCAIGRCNLCLHGFIGSHDASWSDILHQSPLADRCLLEQGCVAKIFTASTTATTLGSTCAWCSSPAFHVELLLETELVPVLGTLVSCESDGAQEQDHES